MNFSSSLHSSFFSSLKQVEKRLKLEHAHQHQHNTSTTTTTTQTQSSSSTLSTPLYILPSQPIIDGDTDSSEPPQAFLHSLTPHTQQPNITPEQEKHHQLYHGDGDGDDDDNISVLLQLLGLSLSSDDDERDDSRYNVCENGVVGFNNNNNGKAVRNNGGDLSESVLDMDNGSDICEYGDGFYEKIVGVKGPKCKEEDKRLEGWISYFMNERIEPLRLAHLLLGKAAFESKGRDCGYGGLDFPSTVQELLQMDPPNITR